MSTTSVVLLLAAAALVAVFAFGSRRASSAPARSVDAGVIEQLRQAGSDLAKPHDIEFFLYFPSEADAAAAATALSGRGFAHRITRAASGSQWLLLLTRSMRPLEAELSRLRSELQALAARHRGEYDWWGSPVVP